jgi:diguanylate cyclase (GGDEF)-like protein
VLSFFKTPSISKVGLVIMAYWILLLLVAIRTPNLSGSEVALPWLVAFGLPLFALAAISVWSILGSVPNSIAYQDDLTGIGNRRAFMLQAKSLLKKAKAGSRGLVLIDIDGLKAFNDCCGHQAGDELLSAVADRLSLTNRYFYRIGGDEFAILVDRTDGETLTASLQLLEPFNMTFVTCGHEHRVCFTYGYASIKQDESFDSLFRRADARLGEFKRQLYASGNRMDRRSTDRSALVATSMANQFDKGSPALPPTVASLEERRRVRLSRNV